MIPERRKRWLLHSAPSWVVLHLSLLFFSVSSSAANVFEEGIQCPVVSDSGVTKKDFRLRDSTPRLKAQYDDNWDNHMAPALGRLKEGVYTASVIADLHFTLLRWPNHYPALQALTTYEKGGGDVDKFVPVSCYFSRALRFVPDDVNVAVLYGIRNHSQKRYDVAEEAWLLALQINDQSMEAHYNLGLLYYQLERHNESLEHARIAYGLGYPLPGLKRKLVSAGYWND